MTQRQQYALVPFTPTTPQLLAASKAWHDDPAKKTSTLYGAMLEAAPPPPDQVLSDEQMEAIYSRWQDQRDEASYDDLMRSVERAVLHNLGAKNGE